MPLDTNFNIDPFYDDFDETKNFHRILYRPGVALQARELTQAQTILQNQIERFGDNIFVQGTIIQGCNITTDDSYEYVKLPDLRVDGQHAIPSDYNGLRVVSATGSNLQAIVVNSENGLESQNPDLHTIYLKYLNSGSAGQKTYAADEQLEFYSNTNPANTTSMLTSLTIKVAPTQINAVNTNPVGKGYAFTIGEGIIYQKGFFIKIHSPITEIISKYSNSPNNVSVGFTTLESIVTEATDSSLVDNASGYSNANAPGANRLKLTPTLTVANSNALPTDNFLPIASWNSGNIVRLNQTTQYNVINKEIARREYETNGDFVVRPFKLNSEVNPASTNSFNTIVSSGLAYVNGYRIQLENSSKYAVRKGTDTANLVGQSVNTGYGNYIVVKEVAGYFTIGSTVTLYDAAASSLTNETHNTLATSGTAIGTATVLSFIYSSGTVDTPSAEYYLYLSNIRMNSGKAFSSTRSFASGTGIADAVLTYNRTANANIAVLADPNFSKTLFYTGKSFVKTLSPGVTVNNSFIFRKNDTVNVNSNGVSSAVILTGNQQFYYGTGTLTSLEEQAVIVIPSSNIFVAVATGTVATTNGSPNVVGTSTTFLTSYEDNDYISVGNSSVYTIKRIKSVVNNTLIIVANNIVNAYTANTHSKVYPRNIPINFTDRNSTITLANTTSMSFALKGVTGVTETLQAAANVNVYYDVKSITTAATQKTLNSNRVVCIDTALFLPFTANITCNTANLVITTTNTAVNNYVSPGYKVYMAGDNSNAALLGTVSSVNSTAITLTANATANCFTFLPLGGTATCDTTNTVITTTNTAVNTHISAGHKIYLASNSLFLGTVATTNTTTITLTSNAAANISANAINFSSATNQITISANGAIGPNGPWNLGFPDVYKLKSVYKVPAGSAFTTNSAYDVTSSFILQTNQTDTTYGISQLARSPGAGSIPVNNGDKLTIVFDVFTIPAITSPGYFSVDSYPIDDANTANTSAIQTQHIPNYTTSTGQLLRLRDYIDFRAYTANTIALIATANLQNASANAAVINPPGSNTFTSNGFITPDQSFNYDVSYYLGRIDKVHLSPTGQVSVIEGFAAETPVPAQSPQTGMVLGTITVPPYPTLVSSQITTQTNGQPIVTTSAQQNRGFTMKDIDGINSRVSKLEYYSALTALEQKSKNLVIKNDLTGIDRFKNGIFVDNFENAAGSNLLDKEYFISIDATESSIIPRFDEFKIDLKYDTNENANTVLHSHTKTNDVVTLAYTQIPYLTQNTATQVRNCIEGYYNWTGAMRTVPLYDGYIDQRIPAQNPNDYSPAPIQPSPEQQNDGGQPYIAPPVVSFPRPQSGNYVWFAENDTAIFVPGDFVNGNVVYNSALGFYTVTDPVPVTGGPVIETANTGGGTIVYPTGNTDPIIPQVQTSDTLTPIEPPLTIPVIESTELTSINWSYSWAAWTFDPRSELSTLPHDSFN